MLVRLLHDQRCNVKTSRSIRLVLSDVDGTLITPDKVITEHTQAVVRKLEQENIAFAITSGRPPRGMRMLVEPLRLRTPIAGFNGGMTVRPDMTPIDMLPVPRECVAPIVRGLIERGLDAWIYQDNDWFVRDASAPHVERESRTVRFAPTVTRDLERHTENVAKIVGVSADHPLVKACEEETRARFGDRLSVARSQPYYVDITHPDANKGEVVRRVARELGIAYEAIAAIGDQANDVLMFALAGLSIAMGQSTEAVKRSARHVTRSNTEDGFAEAIERYILNEH
jgi:Cof subfamily protein (haloacid dehalogenase superfamily)